VTGREQVFKLLVMFAHVEGDGVTTMKIEGREGIQIPFTVFDTTEGHREIVKQIVENG